MKKLVVLVRKDLPSLAYKAVQGAHAVAAFMRFNEGEWFNETLVFVEATKEQMNIAKIKARWIELPTSSFYEPDMNNEQTALAIGCNKTPSFLSNLPLLE